MFFKLKLISDTNEIFNFGYTEIEKYSFHVTLINYLIQKVRVKFQYNFMEEMMNSIIYFHPKKRLAAMFEYKIIFTTTMKGKVGCMLPKKRTRVFRVISF